MPNLERALSTLAAAVATSESDFAGTWKNELGSTMTIEIVGKKTIKGTYETAVSGEGGALSKHDLNGAIDGNLISFIVNWTDKNAITAWVGQMTGEDAIFTLWQMTMAVKDPQSEYWESILAGSDTFSREAKAKG